jgi:CheY-like chemotaxis protein
MEETNLNNSLKNKNPVHEKSSSSALSNIFEQAKAEGTCSVLLVEDHTMTQMLVKRFLLNCNYTVDAVSDGEAALELTEKNQYDVVLMDLNLPGISGFETAKMIRSFQNKNTNVPILALTSSAEYEVREKMFKSGMNDYIGKPFNPNELYQKVKSFIHLT